MQAPTAPEKRMLNIRETAAYLGVAEKTLYNRSCPSAKDPFPVQPKRIGRMLRWDIKDLEKFISRN